MDLQLKGKVALITGASKGIGLFTALTLAEEGCNVGICARNQDEVDAAVKEIEAKGVKAHGSVVDISDAKSYEKWIGECADKLGGVDIFIPNVSAGGGDPSEDGWRQNFEIDMLGSWRGISAALPYLEKSQAGAIVIISSTSGLERFVSAPPYNAMKAALLRYANDLAAELAPKGIRVNCVSPGPIFIEGGAWDQIKEAMPEVYDQTVESIPMGRLGAAEDVANTVAFLASPRSAFTAGTNVVIDGSMTQRAQF